jgi:energy-coupling factor transport system permease protein
LFIPQSLYLPGDSWLHRLNPLTKLSFSLASLLIIFGGPGMGWAAVLPGLAAVLLLWQSRLAGKALTLVFRLMTPLVLMLFLIHGLFNPNNNTLLVTLGPVSVGQEGLAFAALVSIRLTAALVVSLLLVTSTHPAHLVQALEAAGLPSSLAYLLGSPLLLIPQMVSRAQAIHSAQQSRGLETRGNFFHRVHALFPLVAPLIYSALADVEERALALEVRGFSAPGPKTSLIALPDSACQRLARWGFLLLAILLLAVNLIWRIHGSH